MGFNLGMANRMLVLERSLFIEDFANHFLAEILGVKDKRESYLFGHKSTNLSIDTKVSLLIDIGAFDKKVKEKFRRFMEVRNKFMHVIEVKTFEKCVLQVDGLERFLLKNYDSDNTKDKEARLKESFEKLSYDLLDIIFGLLENIKEKYRVIVSLEKQEQIIKHLMNKLSEK